MHFSKFWVTILIGTSAAEDFRFGSQINHSKSWPKDDKRGGLSHMICLYNFFNRIDNGQHR